MYASARPRPTGVQPSLEVGSCRTFAMVVDQSLVTPRDGADARLPGKLITPMRFRVRCLRGDVVRTTVVGVGRGLMNLASGMVTQVLFSQS